MKNLKVLFCLIISVLFSQTLSAMFEDQDSIDKLKGINKKLDGLEAKKVAKIITEDGAMDIYDSLSKTDKERFIGFFTAGKESMEIASIISSVKNNNKTILDAAEDAGF